MQGMYTGVGGKTHFEEDVRSSCLREIHEETGLQVEELTLRAIVKTILKSKNSAWLLFVYTAETPSKDLIECPEGKLEWVHPDAIFSLPLIGFIRELLPSILNSECFLEGIIYHDADGNVLEKRLTSMNNAFPKRMEAYGNI